LHALLTPATAVPPLAALRRDPAKSIVPLRFRPKALVDHLLDETIKGAVVRGGSFAGMSYTDEGYGVLGPKLFGTCECEP
jgi:hypothetical protein